MPPIPPPAIATRRECEHGPLSERCCSPRVTPVLMPERLIRLSLHVRFVQGVIGASSTLAALVDVSIEEQIIEREAVAVFAGSTFEELQERWSELDRIGKRDVAGWASSSRSRRSVVSSGAFFQMANKTGTRFPAKRL